MKGLTIDDIIANNRININDIANARILSGNYALPSEEKIQAYKLSCAQLLAEMYAHDLAVRHAHEVEALNDQIMGNIHSIHDNDDATIM